jgi:hypothetical protein
MLIIGALFGVWICAVPGSFSSSWRVKDPAFAVLMFTAFGMHVILKVSVAIEASRRLNEDRRSGALELLMVTPLSIPQIISGQTAAVRKMFTPAIGMVVIVNIFMFWLIAVPDPVRMRGEMQVMMCEVYAGGLGMLFMDTWALSRVGMLMGLRNRRHHWAIFGTLARLILVPWLGVFFFFLMTASSGRMSAGAIAALTLVYFVFTAIFNAALVAWAYQSLSAELRETKGTKELHPTLGQTPGVHAAPTPALR